MNGYETNKIQEDLLFLDDIKRFVLKYYIERKQSVFSFHSYHEVFNTFISFGFVWQDKEFRLAKMKANYIYDHYMSTPEAITKVLYIDQTLDHLQIIL